MDVALLSVNATQNKRMRKLLIDYPRVNHQAATPAETVMTRAGCPMGNDYPVENYMRRVWERYRQRHSTLSVQEQETRKLPNPPLSSPNLLSRF
jgi:hypothetical protein